MSKTKAIPYVIIMLLSLALLAQHCADVPNSTTTSDTVVTYDTIKRVVRTKPRLIYTYRTDTVLRTDTAYILQDYTTSKVYEDSVINDTLSIYVKDTISRNSIQGRSVGYVLRLPTRTITNTTTVTKRPSGLYLGAYGSSPATAGLSATFVTPRYLGTVGYGTTGLHVGVGVRLGR